MQENAARPLPNYQEYPTHEMQQRADRFYSEIRRRHTIRNFSSRPVPRQIIEACILAAGTAPSGANHQPWFFACIQNQGIKRQIREKAEIEEEAFYSGRAGEEWLEALRPLGTDNNKPYLEIAPWLIAIFAQRRGGITVNEARKNYYINESVGIATGFLIAALHEAGLATLTHTPKPMDFLNQLCGRPENDKPYILLVTGYPAVDATVPEHALVKKSLSDIASFI